MLLIFLFAIAVAGYMVERRTPQTKSAMIDLGYSKYQGSVLAASNINRYLGMRYAAPPIGNLRWRAPTDPNITSGVQNATAWGNICLGSGVAWPSSTQSEDCLRIHVFTPRTATPASKFSVWLFIPGGGYNTNSNAYINGTKILQKSNNSVVMVSFSYRVGLYGFLASEKVRADGDLNAGLLDQRKAMKWVKQYISQFGGDPNHVVIHGLSAGAGSVATHLSAYGGRNDNLFVGAIGESVFMPWTPPVSQLEFQYTALIAATNCSTAVNQMACLRSFDTSVLQAQNKAGKYPNATAIAKFYWTATVDGDLIRDFPMRSITAGKIINVPVLFGADTDDGASFAPEATSPGDISQFFLTNYPNLTNLDTAAINAQYPLMPALSGHAAYFLSAAAAYGELTFACPAYLIAQAYSSSSNYSSNKSWLYRYNGQGKNGSATILVTHTVEYPAVFGTRMAGDSGTSFESYNAPMVDTLMDYWLSFVRDLNPNTYKWSQAPVWETYKESQGRIMLQTNRTAMENLTPAYLDRCAFWKGYIGKTEI